MPGTNRILAVLPADEYERLRPDLEDVSLAAGQSVYDPDDELQYAYFPTSGVISLAHLMSTGALTDIAIVGNEGLVGVGLFMGSPTSPRRAIVRCPGHALRLTKKSLKAEFRRGGALQCVLLRYVQALMTQIAQTAVCNRHHLVEKQLGRWLLEMLDRLQASQLSMTQESIAGMLGVRREGVTEAAIKLQAAGLIRYTRGHITLIDRAGLEARACECYRIVADDIGGILKLPLRD